MSGVSLTAREQNNDTSGSRAVSLQQQAQNDCLSGASDPLSG